MNICNYISHVQFASFASTSKLIGYIRTNPLKDLIRNLKSLTVNHHSISLDLLTVITAKKTP